MGLTDEQIEEKINEQSEQIAKINYDLKEVVNKVNIQSGQINKIDEILENQKQSTQRINDLDNRMLSIEGGLKIINDTLKNIESKLNIQESYIQKIPDLSEKVGELKSGRQFFVIFITGFLSLVSGLVIATFGWYLRAVTLNN